MVLLLACSLVGAVAFGWREYKMLWSVDTEKIDEPMNRLLRNGTVKLLSCSWLLEEADEVLPRAQSGLPTLMRLQEMPEAAFLPRHEAARIFALGKRKVLVLSYGWLSAEHADPTGSRLELLRRFLRGLDDANE